MLVQSGCRKALGMCSLGVEAAERKVVCLSRATEVT